jgi:AmiR/NasT family two-component response regulator
MEPMVLTALQAEVQAADERLAEAWLTRVGLEEALAAAKDASARLGRDPVIEDAKVVLANVNGCSPSQAFVYLKNLSQRTNCKLRDVARQILDVSESS